MNGSTFHSVYLDASLCVGCTTCIKRCPTQAIRVREGKAHIMEERCIDCGECIRTCPKGAKKSASDPLALMDGYDVRVALPAPSLYGQFGIERKPGEVFAALRSLGFDEVFDVAWGAKILTVVLRDFIDKDHPRPLVSSACPVIVRLIQLRFPSLIANLVPFLPPVEIAAREVRKRLASESSSPGSDRKSGARGRKRTGIFFISPCTSKVTAIRTPLGYGSSQVDAVFSFQDIFTAVRQAMASPGAMSHSVGSRTKLPRSAGLGEGFSWARSDGELDALDIPGAVSVDGIGNVIALLEEIDNGKLADIPYIEALACPGGCVGGPMAVANPHVARTTIKTIAREENRGHVDNSSAQCPARSLKWEEELLPKPVMVLDRTMAKALQMAEAMEAIVAGLPGLDCGACGAPDCRAFAEDIVKGDAKIDDCIVRMKQKIVAEPVKNRENS